MKQIRCSKSEMLGIRMVLERSIQRAERRKAAYPDDPSAEAEREMLAQAVADLDDELAHS
jgi:hypothetical protein